MVDAYKVSKHLSNIKLDDLFYKSKLHEHINLDQREKGIYLIVSKSDVIKVKV